MFFRLFSALAVFAAGVTRLLPLFAERFDKSRIASPAQLSRFVRTRAAYVAQESLYGYLKTRMGTQFPQYFQDAGFSRLIRDACLRLFVSCLADLTVFSVALAAKGARTDREACCAVARECFRSALDAGLEQARAGESPADAEGLARDAIGRFEARLAYVSWEEAAEGENAFAASAEDLLRYAPVIDEFKELDRGIVVNSIRFRWRDVREQFRRRVDGRGVFGGVGG